MASFYYIDGVHNASVERTTCLEEPQILSHKMYYKVFESTYHKLLGVRWLYNVCPVSNI
jgi:hypothetical protein